MKYRNTLFTQLVCGIAVVAVLIGGFTVTPSYGQTTAITQIFRVPFSSGGATICGGIPVVFSGTLLASVHFTVSPTGGTYTLDHINYQDAKVTDTTNGATGTITQTSNDIEHIQQGPGGEFVDTTTGTLTIPRDGIHSLFQLTSVLVFNANGQPTAMVDNISLRCL